MSGSGDESDAGTRACVEGASCDLAGVVDVIGEDERAVVAGDVGGVEVGHHAVVPEEGVADGKACGARHADDLAAAVDAETLADGVARQGAEGANAVLLRPADGVGVETPGRTGPR